VTQSFRNDSLDRLLSDCLTLTYNAIHFGEENGITNRKGMKEFYRSLKEVELPSCYKVAVITRACVVLESRKKGARRGFAVRRRKPLRPVTCLISGFFVTMKGRLFIPLAKRNDYADVLLNRHVRHVIEGKKLRSLTITPDSLSICYSEEVSEIPIRTVFGVDRNEKNLTFGDRRGVVQIDLSKTVRIRQTIRAIVGSFKRPDVRVRKRLAAKYWRRARNRVNYILHATTNFMVDRAVADGAAFALEDLTDIRKMYQRGNGQGADFRFRLNSWPYYEAYRMLEYKSAWKGVIFVPLTRAETYGSSSECTSCGERLRDPAKGDAGHRRMLWCQRCKVWTDRDVNAALNLSERGRSRFDRSLPPLACRQQQVMLLAGEKGLASEAVMGNGMTTPILRVDARKVGLKAWPGG
jgi:putative transposase